MRTTTAVRLATVLTAAAALAGCSSGGGAPGPAAASAPDGYGCLTAEQAAKGSVTVDGLAPVRAYFRDSDAGGARTAVVLSHQNGGSLCDWIPYLDAFTGAGYAVLPYTANGNVSDNIQQVAGYLKTKGVAGLVLVGASKGGTGSIVAGSLPDLALPPAAVVSLSSAESFGGDSASSAVKRLTVPVLFAAEQGDQPFADYAHALHDTAAAKDKQLKIYPGAHHGAPLLSDGALPDVLAFLARTAPPKG
ncbi:alpha/beta fold hydrolase [Streptomyces sp. NRRL B-24484]|uniref:alpha/beta fold hydrolase n=1 Tax=Streptomyces sp. NRRL B-24484 TaxID=1463833 RepID=UPI0004BF5ACF|nr:alpha/beta hydrolase [Streptomyces sp. NRRL B-24484]